ncbi:MAG: C-terminal processing protease CtpA/Prc [Cyclobacteriaceae bacterium]|jgi:C-terminal processing protease CtpA/Prc
MYGFILPDGFAASISNQRYYDVDGTNYEGKGIPVDKYVIHSKDDLKTRVDPLITSALGLLNNQAAWNN